MIKEDINLYIRKDINPYDRQKLLLIWDLLRESKKKFNSDDEDKYGKEYFHFCTIDYKDEELGKILAHLIANKTIIGLYSVKYEEPCEAIEETFFDAEIIKEIVNEKIKENEESKTLDKKLGIKYEKLKYKLPTEVITSIETSLFNIHDKKDIEEGRYYWAYYLRLDQKKANQYFQNYLQKWQEGYFVSNKINLLKPEKQLENVVDYILQLLEDYPDQYLQIKNTQEKNVEFILVYLFLEAKNYIEIDQHSFSRINIKQKFYDDFKKENVDYKAIIESRNKSELISSIDKTYHNQPLIKMLKNDVYKDDEHIFIIWRFLKGAFSKSKKDNAEYLKPINYNLSTTYFFLNWLILRNLNIELNELKFDYDLFLKYSMNQVKIIESSKTNEIIKKILDNDFNTKDIVRLFYMPEDIYHFIEYNTKINDVDKLKVKKYLFEYINNFIKNLLISDKENYYSYEKHNSILNKILSKMYDNYGESFIIEQSMFPNNKSFLFIHSIVAFEYQDFLEVLNISTYDSEIDPNDQDEEYKIKIRLKKNWFIVNKDQDDVIGNRKEEYNENKPTYSFANIDIYCDTDNTSIFLRAEYNKKSIRNNKIRGKDFIVLMELVKKQGGILQHDKISSILSGETYDEFYSSNDEINRSISRLRKIEGIKIINKKSIGYYLVS